MSWLGLARGCQYLQLLSGIRTFARSEFESFRRPNFRPSPQNPVPTEVVTYSRMAFARYGGVDLYRAVGITLCGEEISPTY